MKKFKRILVNAQAKALLTLLLELLFMETGTSNQFSLITNCLFACLTSSVD